MIEQRAFQIGSIYFDDVSEIPPQLWRWPDFRPEEMRCKGTGGLLIDMRAMDRLQRLRAALGQPIIVFSAFRSHAHNKKVGGAQFSFHRQGRAYDITVRSLTLDVVADEAKKVGFTGIGRYATFVHVDDGPARSWAG